MNIYTLFPGGRGAVIMLVPVSENSRQGALLAAFYRRNRIGNGGCYRVRLAGAGR